MIFRSVYLTMLFYWSLFLTALALFAPLQVPSYYFFLGLLCVWAIFFMSFLGYLKGRGYGSNIVMNIVDFPTGLSKFSWSYKGMIVILTVSFLLSQYALNFYTGQTLISLVNNLMSGESLYALYQAYFMDEGLSVFTVSKIPAIMSLIALKLIVLWGVYVYYFQPRVIEKRYYVILGCICINYLMFSFARGTNFELFEIFFMFLVAGVLRIKYRESTISMSTIVIILVMVVAVASLYISTVSARFSGGNVWECSTDWICLDTSSILYNFVPALGLFLFLISGYFLFGLLYISVFLYSFLYDAGHSSLAVFFPLGFDLVGVDITREAICNNYLDCGASWTPSIIVLLSAVGVFGVAFVLFVVGYFAAIFEKNFLKYGFMGFVLLFYVLLLSISLPVGNFVFTSSNNTVIFFCAFMLFMSQNVLRRRGNSE